MLAEGSPTDARASLDRNLAFELVRVTEAAALASARWMGKGDKNAADQAAVNAMRFAVDPVDGTTLPSPTTGRTGRSPLGCDGLRTLVYFGRPPEEITP